MTTSRPTRQRKHFKGNGLNRWSTISFLTYGLEKILLTGCQRHLCYMIKHEMAPNSNCLALSSKQQRQKQNKTKQNNSITSKEWERMLRVCEVIASQWMCQNGFSDHFWVPRPNTGTPCNNVLCNHYSYLKLLSKSIFCAIALVLCVVTDALVAGDCVWLPISWWLDWAGLGRGRERYTSKCFAQVSLDGSWGN